MAINISGLNKVTLLRMLWHKMKGLSEGETYTFDEKAAASTIPSGYIHDFKGVPIRCNISGSLADPQAYDEKAGAGAFRQIVNKLRFRS